METVIERESKWLPFLCPVGMSTEADAVLVSAFFCIRQSRFYYIAAPLVVDFYIFPFVSVAYDDFTIRVSGEPSRASEELNDFLILTNERPTRFYYLFCGWTSRAIFLYWPTGAILIFFEGSKGIPPILTGLTSIAVRRRSRIHRGREWRRGRFWGLRP